MTVRPLVVRFGGFGDLVMLIPLLVGLRERYGCAPDLVSSGSWVAPLFAGRSLIGDLRTLRSRKTPYRLSPEQRDWVRALRRGGPRPVYVGDPTPKTHWLLRRAGLGPHLCTVLDHPRHDGEHEVARWRRLVQMTPPAWSDTPTVGNPEALVPCLTVTDAARQSARSWLARQGWDDGPLVLVQPGSKKTMKGGNRRRASNVKFWPERSWAAVVDAIVDREPTTRVLLTGVPKESGYCDDILARCRTDRVVSATSDLSIPRLLAVQSLASGMVSIDTGPAHSAAAVGCPVVVLFGRSDPRAFRPVADSAPVEVITPGSVPVSEWRPGAIEPGEVVAGWDRIQAMTRIPERMRL